MPLIRSTPIQAAPALDFAKALANLTSDDAGLRRAAAARLGEARDSAAPAALAACLPNEADGAVREAIFVALTASGGAEIAALLAPLLRAEKNAPLRNGAVEALKRLRGAAAGALDDLLRDPDPDVRLLAIEVMRNWPPADACPRLEILLTQDPHINVAAAAVDIALAAGDASLLPALMRCRQRFAGQIFLEFAIDAASAALAPSPKTTEPRPARRRTRVSGA